MVDRRIERGSATRERLIDVAEELFGEQGFDATPIDAILASAGVARGALYHHFSSKEALFDAVLEREIAELADAAAGAARAAGDPVAALRAGLDAWLELVRDARKQRIVLVDPTAVVGWERVRELDHRHVLGGLRASLRAIADAGGLPPADVDMLAHMVLAAVGEVALVSAHADDPDDALRRGRSAIDTLLDRLVQPQHP